MTFHPQVMTQREARQRAEVNNARIRFNREWGEYIVVLNEWTKEECDRKAYHTDDLEDAVLTAGKMRRDADDHAQR